MKRREFLKSMAVTLVASQVSNPLSLSKRDDTKFLQRCIDTGKKIPFRSGQHVIIENCTFIASNKQICF